MLSMKLRRPYTTASIWSSGRITCIGATSEEQGHQILMLMPLLMAFDVQLSSRLGMLETALVGYKNMCGNLEKELTNAKQLPVADQSIENVISSEVYQHTKKEWIPTFYSNHVLKRNMWLVRSCSLSEIRLLAQ
ncbi:PREDICTED: uncharacterized protein LOC108360636 [Rhagoletis zephyria]|uniref:uncharacterized protein LOC108360636 n=1 Tax=Rhagoletis zephyria TaxID=28612 RepID=UPI0008115C64|nr:PREDICTED: uncharacterized protein LOC108360636 [Rhagoletis zephyria]XP_036335447.1 uncharacterized protein LOC118745893 [Rhagoletis pomonella]